MGHHTNTIIKNSCLKVPIDPVNRLPLASYERYIRHDTDSKRTVADSDNDGEKNKNSLSLGDFYKSIPDYNDVNHLSNQEFYMKLENLRENKQKLLLKNKSDKIAEWDMREQKGIKDSPTPSNKNFTLSTKTRNRRSSKADKYDRIAEKYINSKIISESILSDVDSMLSLDNQDKRKIYSPADILTEKDRKKYSASPKSSKLKGKSISPSLSVSWNNGLNDPLLFKNDDKYLNKSNDIKHVSPSNDDLYRKSYSVPTSPVKKLYSPLNTLTVPQAFKVYERHADNKLLARLKDYSKELEHMYYYQKRPKHFKANPVPIESRIPLYEKILEDQELRRSISKLQSKAELEAQMKPFSFTEREEKWGLRDKMGCSRLYRSNPQLSLMTSPSESELLRYQFKAKPIPKHLFSNYVYEKMREDDFYRTLNRRIRAEEMLKASTLPPSMARREKREERCSYSPCIKYHNNNKGINSDNDIRDGLKYKRRSKSRKKHARNILKEIIQDGELENSSCDTVINCNDDKIKQNDLEEELKRIYGTNSNDTAGSSSGYGSRARSAVDMSAINKSNLAAILRIETTKKKLEADIVKNLEEERYQSEMKWRDSVLRRKPAWKSIQYNHADDLAMRLQMRKDEERLKREQFLHEMELMYGRVHEQPLMFERCYSPRKGVKTKYDFKSTTESNQPKTKHRSNLSKRYLSSDTISRKVSINETAETIGDEIDDYMYNRNSEDDNNSISKSDDDIIECIPEVN